MIPLASPNKMPISIRRRRNRCQIGQLLRSEKIALRFDGSLVIDRTNLIVVWSKIIYNIVKKTWDFPQVADLRIIIIYNIEKNMGIPHKWL